MNLIRQILLAIEESPEPELLSQPVIQGWSNKQVNEHLRLLMDDGYISALTSRGDNMIAFDWIRLLGPGHDFLDLARDNTIWNKAKAQLGKAFDKAGFPIIVATLTKILLG